MLETAAWVCRSGSPERASRWVNCAITSPRTGTWATPLAPVRVNAHSRSNQSSVDATAASCAARIAVGEVAVGDRPQRRDRLDRGEGQVVPGDRHADVGREIRATQPVNSGPDTGARPNVSRNMAAATSVRIRSRTASSIDAFGA